MKNKPNIVLVITDDQGYGDLGCHGNPVLRTPHLDRMFEDSVRLADFHVGPTCAPTRAGLMTGHDHNSTGVWHTIGGRSLLREGEVSLADLCRANGYATGLFGKWHLGDNYPYRPQDRGFDEAVVHGGGGIGQTPDYWGNDYFDDTYYDRGAPRSFEGYCTDVWFRLGLEFIERCCDDDEPFLCVIATNAPHAPFQVEERYAAPYLGRVPDDRAKFYGMIACIDDNFGVLRRRLVQLNAADDTILIFMTDNGSATGCELDQGGFVAEGYNAGMRGKKGSPYEGGHRVPLFLRWPAGGIGGGRDVGELAAYTDVVPTLLDLCGMAAPEGLAFDGRSLAPLLRGTQEPWPARAVVTDSQRVPVPVKWKSSAVMRGKWRLINGSELYRLDVDPGQRNDVAAQYPQLIDELRQAYDRWWERVSRQFGEEIPIRIGSPHEPVARITSHDWRGGASDCAWNQGQIRAGKRCHSYVEVAVEAAGRYRFELRRGDSRPPGDAAHRRHRSFDCGDGRRQKHRLRARTAGGTGASADRPGRRRRCRQRRLLRICPSAGLN
ncbi:MAG: arylsulfatase [Paenibacillaceae bacterium]|nr:arylsulfatase [Paenibacillaceae bacterium]